MEVAPEFTRDTSRDKAGWIALKSIDGKVCDARISKAAIVAVSDLYDASGSGLHLQLMDGSCWIVRGADDSILG